MRGRYSKDCLNEMFWEALDYFNDCMESDFNEDNTVIDFFTPENGVAVYEDFCKQHFPGNLKEPYLEKGYFEGFVAQAFLNGNMNGVLIREDVDFEKPELFLIFLHEISHLFCTRNEVKDGEFFDSYCMGKDMESDFTYVGYAVWREAIADIMADAVLTDMATSTLEDNKDTILQYYQEIGKDNPDSKKAMSLIIAYTMISNEVAGTEDWKVAEKAIRQNFKIKDEVLYSLFKLVFENLHNPPFWTITQDFICSLGTLYLLVMSNREISKFGEHISE